MVFSATDAARLPDTPGFMPGLGGETLTPPPSASVPVMVMVCTGAEAPGGYPRDTFGAKGLEAPLELQAAASQTSPTKADRRRFMNRLCAVGSHLRRHAPQL